MTKHHEIMRESQRKYAYALKRYARAREKEHAHARTSKTRIHVIKEAANASTDVRWAKALAL